MPGTSISATADARDVRFEPDPARPRESVAQFELGGPTRATCTFAPWAGEQTAPAHLLSAVVTSAVKAFSPDAAPALSSRVRAGAVGGAPFLSLDVALVREERGVLVLQRLAVRHERVVHCVWMTVEDGAALDRLFASLVGTLAIDPEPAAPVYRAVYSFHVSGEPRGAIEFRITEEPPDLLRLESRHFGFRVSEAGSRLHPGDFLVVQRTYLDGTLLSARTVEHIDFASRLALSLRRAGPATWRVVGTVGEEAVDSSFDADPPDSDIRLLWANRDAVRSRRFDETMRARVWNPSRYYWNRFQEVEATLSVSDTGTVRGRQRGGDRITEYTLDADGSADSAWGERDGISFEQRREAVYGEWPEPRPR